MNTQFLIDHHPASGKDRHVIRALLRIQGDAPDADNRIPLNLSAVLDNSGSMGGEKLDRAREAATGLLAGVHPDDVTSVVTFESDVEVVASAAPRATQHALSTRIAQITTRGTTNLSGGWLEGRSQIERHLSSGKSNRIVLMTDGHANAGITDPDQLTALFTEARHQGITTSTIGFGRDFDEALLERLADAGGGNAHYIEHPDQAPAVFRAELDELLTLSAQNVVAEIRLEPHVELAAVHHTYPREGDGDVLRLRLGDLYASEPKQLLLELGAHATGTEPTALASVVIRADVLMADGSMEQREITLPLASSVAGGPVVNAEVQRTLVLLQAATTRREALEDERRGLHEDAARKLRTAARHVREKVRDDEGREEANDLERMAKHLEERTFSVMEAKYMRSRSYSETRGKPSMKERISRAKREERGLDSQNRHGRTRGSSRDRASERHSTRALEQRIDHKEHEIHQARQRMEQMMDHLDRVNVELEQMRDELRRHRV